MSNELISVIVPVYKMEAYLRRCVDSILNQTYENLEIILVDDGSPDGCPAICDEYAEKDKRVHVIHKENGGLSSARNAGMDYVYKEHRELLGEYIAFIDSDDWIHKQYFEILKKYAYITQSDITVCDTQWVWDSPNEDIYIDSDKVSYGILTLREILGGSDARKYVWGRIYKKELIENQRFDTHIIIEDTPFNIKLVCENNNISICWINEKLHFYFQRGDSLVHTMNELKLVEMSRYYISLVNNGDGDISDQIRYQEALRWYFSTRYAAGILKERTLYKECSAGAQICAKKIKNHQIASLKRRLAYKVCASSFFIYRLFRIIDDPTLIKWEKAQKKKLKEAEKSEKSEK